MLKNNDSGNATLKELFDRNTNLLTILGIFNALAIFANSQNSTNNTILTTLSLCFMTLSLIVLWLVIVDIYNNISSFMCLIVVFILGYAEVMLFNYTLIIYHHPIFQVIKFHLPTLIGLIIIATIIKMFYSKLKQKKVYNLALIIISLITFSIMMILANLFDKELTAFFNHLDGAFIKK